MNSDNTSAQNKRIRRTSKDQEYDRMEKSVSAYAVKVNKRKPYEMAGKWNYVPRVH